jgi:hypothetical protein
VIDRNGICGVLLGRVGWKAHFQRGVYSDVNEYRGKVKRKD